MAINYSKKPNTDQAHRWLKRSVVVIIILILGLIGAAKVYGAQVDARLSRLVSTVTIHVPAEWTEVSRSQSGNKGFNGFDTSLRTHTVHYKGSASTEVFRTVLQQAGASVYDCKDSRGEIICKAALSGQDVMLFSDPTRSDDIALSVQDYNPKP